MFSGISFCSRSILRLVSILTVSILVVPSLAQAGTTTNATWTGGGGASNNWNNTANWSGGNQPQGTASTSPSSTIVNFAGTTGLTSNDDYGDYTTMAQIEFNSGAGSFTISGNAIKIWGNGIQGKIENMSSNLQTINDLVDLVGNSELDPTNGNLTINGQVIIDANSGNQNVNVYGNGHTLTLNGAVTNGSGATGSITEQGTNTIVFTNSGNTYTGFTTLNGAGTIQLGNGGTTGLINSSTIVFNTGSNTSASSGTLAINLTGSQTVSSNLVMSNANDWANVAVTSGQTATLSGSITGAGEFWTTGAGNLVITPNSGSASRSASNVISTGTLSVSDFSTSTLGSGGFFIANGTLNYTGSSTSTTRLGNFALQAAGSTISVANSGTTLTLGTNIGGFSGGGLVKAGAGTLALNATESYTAATSVQAGTLEVDGSLNSSSAVTIGGAGSSGTPLLQGTGTVGGSVTVSSASTGVAGTINAGTSTIGTLTVGSIAFQNGSTMEVNLNSSTANKLVISGAATFAGTDNITFNGSTGATTTTGVGDYQLATAASGLATGAFTGTAPTDYRLLGSGASLDLVHQATIGTISATPAAASIITGGSTGINFTVSNTAPSGSSSLSASAASGSNTTGSVAGPITAAGGATSGTQTGLSFNGTTVGASQTGSFTVSDPNADNATQTGSVSVNVYGHASGSLSGSTLNIGNVHVGYTSPVTSSNSVTASNASGFRVNLSGSGSNGNESLTSVTGVTPGSSSGNITATLATGQGVGNLSPVTYTYADNSALSGNSSNVGTTSVTVTGQVYSGTSTWASSTGGSWGSLSSNFGSNWGANQGSPGLDSNFTSTDTATFGTAVTSGTAHVTLDVTGNNPSLKAVTFNNTNAGASYSIDQGTGSGSVVLNGTGNSGNLATVTNSNGANTISAPVSLATSANINVASGQTLTVSGAISGSGTGLNLVTGTGTTILTNANTYSGGTVVNAGTLYVNGGTPGTTSSGTGSGAVTVNSGGTLAGNGNIDPTNPVTINAGGTLASGGAQTNAPNITGTGISFYNTNVVLSGTGVGSLSANLTFDLGAGNPTSAGYHTFGNPNTASTSMTLSGTSTLGFTTGSTESVSLVDLTNGALALRQGTPYLLATAASDADYLNLVINTGTVANPVLSLSQNDTTQNGYVLGVWTGTAFNYTTIGINQYGPDGSTPLGTGTTYPAPVLYLDAGELEVVPEPGTWALMVSGLALLVFCLRRKSS